ncbi:2-dehydropantoate 2-reductase N-terminal domain-containing protein [Lachnospiraceae bacterium 54-11]
MRILVYGAGVLGCNLANNLYHGKKDVTLLARGVWAKQLKQNGLHMKKTFHLRESVSRVPVITQLEPNDCYDVIFVVVRYTQLDGVMEDLRANGTKNIVFVGNNIRPAHYASLFPEKNIMFAFALSAGHREPARVVSLDLKKITIGQLKNAPSNETLIGRIFAGTGYRVVYEPNMEDYLLCHAAFVLPAAFACYYTDGDLSKLKGNTACLNRVLDANIEGYRAIERAGHAILPASDMDYESIAYRKTCLRFFRLMCATGLGKLCASDHAMNAVDEMDALNRDMKAFFDETGAVYPVWRMLERDIRKYLIKNTDTKQHLGDVQETALIPLAIRANETERKTARIHDNKAVAIIRELDVDTEKLDRFFSHEGVIARTIMFDEAVKKLLRKYPGAVCVNIGCGLDDRFTRVDNGKVRWFHVDLADSIEMRKHFFHETEREHMLAADILRAGWTEQIPKNKVVIVIAEGLFMYFSKEQVQTVLNSITGSFDRGFLLVELMHPKMMNEKKHDTVKNTSAKFGWGTVTGRDLLPLDAKLMLINERSFWEEMKKYSLIGKIGSVVAGKLNNRLAVYRWQ